MKKYLFIVGILSILTSGVFACGTSTNGITEVGNPTPQQRQHLSEVNGTLSVASNSIGGFLDTFSNSNQSTTSNFDCNYDENTQSTTCNCTGGGNVVYTFASDYVENGNLVTFNSTFTTTLNQCVTTSCETQITLNGQYTGSMSGSFDSSKNTGDISIVFNTASDCAGLTIDSDSIGFSMSMTQSNSETSEFSGNICINDETNTFTSLDDLSQQIDPNTTCNNLFN